MSIIATFFFMGQLGLSLNVMSLAGLALATGMVVDDSIVVLESIAKARERGLGILQAAITGTREVSMAVVASTLTTVAVFFPLVFVRGRGRPAVQGPGADGVDRADDFAGRVADPDPDAVLDQGQGAAGVPAGGAASGVAADLAASWAALRPAPAAA